MNLLEDLNQTQTHTTGKTAFAEIRDFCREQKRGLSAKKTFAERGSWQTPAVGKYTVHLRYNHSFFVMVMYLHVTQLGVSRSKEVQLEICRSLHINNRICFELSTFFWTAR